MALTLQECIDKIKKEYPKMFPYAYIELEGKYVFDLVPKGQDPEEAISDMHIVDPENGYVSGGVSIMEFLKDAGFREKWKKPNLVANHDESLGHSSVLRNPFERGWSVRRKTNSERNTGCVRVPFSDYSVKNRDPGLTYDGVLCHHGIKGQSWGVRNGPPYPLNKQTHDKVVKGEGKPSGDGRTGIAAETALLLTQVVPLVSMLAVKFYLSRPKVQDRMKTKMQAKFNERNAKLSEDLIGDIADVGKHYSSDDMPPQIKGKHSIEDDMAACNPRYNNGTVPGTCTNCTLCAFTYDLRRRGYDVTAMSSDTGNVPDKIVESLYSNAKEETISASNFTKVWNQAAQKYPEGSRGEISVSGPYMGHSMAWEIRNGKLEVIDTQRNVKSSPQELQKFGFYSSKVKFIRTDNLELKPEGIHLVSAAYKPGAKKILAEERKQLAAKTESKAPKTKKLSDAERRKNYEEQYLKEHPNADKNAAGLKNWVDARMGK